MSTFQTTNADAPLDDAQIEKIVTALANGVSIGDVCNISSETIEGLYTLGYNLYTAGNYTDAETVFQMLCVYKSNDVRFWTGLAGCMQANNNLKGAIDAYSMAGITGSLSDPQPFLFATLCFIKLGERENAINAIKGLLTIGSKDNPDHMACWTRAQELLTMLESQE